MAFTIEMTQEEIKRAAKVKAKARVLGSLANAISIFCSLCITIRYYYLAVAQIMAHYYATSRPITQSEMALMPILLLVPLGAMLYAAQHRRNIHVSLGWLIISWLSWVAACIVQIRFS